MVKNRIKVESKDKEGNVKIVYVTRPNRKQNMDAQLEANKAFKHAVMNESLVGKTLEDFLIRDGIWSPEKQAKVDKLDEEIREKLIQLKSGGCKLVDGRDLAIEIRIARMNRASLMAERNVYDEFTAESQATNAKFEYLASVCIRDEEDKPVFQDVDDYQNKADEPYASEAAAKLATMTWGLDDQWEANLPENTFLKKYKFVDEDLRLINKDGKHVTKDNKLIDNDFRYINQDGEYVDIDGKRIDKDGLPVVEFQPFLDDNGNPILDDETEAEVKVKKTKVKKVSEEE